MQSNNPVFRRSEAFNGQVSGQGTNAYGNQTYPGNGAGYQGYGQAPGYDQQQSATPTTTGRPMTIDSVVQKTGIALAVVIVFATITWWYIGDIRPTAPDVERNTGILYVALMIGSFGAFGLSLVNSFKRVISPALVIAFCALEGVALGALRPGRRGVGPGRDRAHRSGTKRDRQALNPVSPPRLGSYR